MKKKDHSFPHIARLALWVAVVVGRWSNVSGDVRARPAERQPAAATWREHTAEDRKGDGTRGACRPCVVRACRAAPTPAEAGLLPPDPSATSPPPRRRPRDTGRAPTDSPLPCRAPLPTCQPKLPHSSSTSSHGGGDLPGLLAADGSPNSRTCTERIAVVFFLVPFPTE